MVSRLLQTVDLVRSVPLGYWLLAYVGAFLIVGFMMSLWHWMGSPKRIRQPKPEPVKEEPVKVRTRKDKMEDLLREHEETMGLVDMVPLDPEVKESVKEQADHAMLEDVVNLIWRKS